MYQHLHLTTETVYQACLPADRGPSRTLALRDLVNVAGFADRRRIPVVPFVQAEILGSSPSPTAVSTNSSPSPGTAVSVPALPKGLEPDWHQEEPRWLPLYDRPATQQFYSSTEETCPGWLTSTCSLPTLYRASWA
jgi:hypothetical protein